MTSPVQGAFLTPDMLQVLDWVPAMIWVSGVEGECVHVNKAWQDYTGKKLEDCLGNGWLAVMHPEDAEAWPVQIHQVMQSGQDFTLECRLRRRDGRYRWLVKHGQPIHDAAGALIGFLGACADVTAQKEALDALHQASDKHRSVLSNLKDAVCVMENLLGSINTVPTPRHDDRLTRRQSEILHLIARGFPTREIAAQLHVSSKTVESHRAQLMQRLNIHDVAGLTRYAIRTGLVQPDF